MDDTRAHLLHREALEFVRPVGQARAIEPRQRTATQLFCPLRGDVDKKESTGDWCCALGRDDRGAVGLEIFVSHVSWSVLERWLALKRLPEMTRAG